MSQKSGFTLIELMIVIAIIAVLSAIAMISYGNFLKSARDTRRQSDLKLIQSGLERYHADQKYYPATLSLTGYLNTIPTDPGTNIPYSYSAYTPNVSECTQCTRYHLYATLENPPQLLEVTSPD